MLDTTVFLAGTVWPRFPYEILQHALRGDFQIVVSPMLLAETRRKFQERFPEFAPDFEAFLATISFEEVSDPLASQVVENLALMRDSTDVPLALAAIGANADFFVSDDKDFTSPGQPVHDKLRIMQSGTFLNQVMGRTHEELEIIKRRRWADISPQ